MNRDDHRIRTLCNRVRQTAFELHVHLKSGHLEKVYENGRAHRLRKSGLSVEQQKPLLVRDKDGTLLGSFFADLFVENCLVIELKPPGLWPLNISLRRWAISVHLGFEMLWSSISVRQNSR